MKTTAALLLTLAASASAFAPQQSQGRTSVAQNALADRIFGMDLYNRDGNKYGARAKKNLKVGELKDNSYIPAGLTKAQYAAIRQKEQQKKEQNYQRNVAKAFKFTDFTEWYKKRGTSLDFAWKKDINLGHDMAKTKYDWTGKDVSVNKLFESTRGVDVFAGKKKVAATAAKKAPVAKKAAAPKKRYIY
jgi:hypothetical protein